MLFTFPPDDQSGVWPMGLRLLRETETVGYGMDAKEEMRLRMRRWAMSLVLMAGLALGAAPSAAQLPESELDALLASVSAACRGGGDCALSLERATAAIAASGPSNEGLDRQLAALSSVAVGSGAPATADLAQALRSIVGRVGTPEVAEALTEVAASIEAEAGAAAAEGRAPQSASAVAAGDAVASVDAASAN